MTVLPSPPLAPHLHAVAPFHVMSILAQAQQMQAEGRSIYHLEIGEPDFATPAPIMAAAQQALANQYTRYTPANGLPALKCAIAEHYISEHIQHLNDQQIIITAGASMGLTLLFSALLSPGDEVILTDPTYPCYTNLLRLNQAQPVWVTTTAQQQFQPSAAQIQQAASAKTKAIVLSSPANPTGTLLPADTLAEIMALAQAHDWLVIVDETYQGMTYDDEYAEVLAQPAHIPTLYQDEYASHLCVVNSFSKRYAMTGFRLGWVVVPTAYVDTLNRLCQNLPLAPPTLAQYAALAIYQAPTKAIIHQQITHHRMALKQRRDYLMSRLPDMNLALEYEPQGAFYVLAKVQPSASGHINADQFAHHALHTHGVALTPAKDFGSAYANTHCRIAYTLAQPQLEAACNLLSQTGASKNL